MKNSMEKKYREAVKCLQENADLILRQQEFLQNMKNTEFQHQKKERLLEMRIEQLQTKVKELENRPTYTHVSSGRRAAGNSNYSPRIGEDIYGRFSFPYTAVEAGSRIVIYGGGIVGKTFLEQLARNTYCHVVAVCDKNPSKTGIYEVPVITIRELASMKKKSYDQILIAIEKKSIAIEIKEELKMAGISKGKIKWFDPAKRI